MLFAKDENNNWINAINAEKQNNYSCPDCKKSVILKLGTRMVPHFSHFKKCQQTSFSEGETLEHLQGKQLIYKQLIKLGYTVQLEAYLSNIKQRPDLLIEVNDVKIAIEFQCSVIAPELVKKRTKLYEEYNYKVIWIVGNKNAIKKTLTYYYLNEELFQFYFNVNTKKLYIKCYNKLQRISFDCLLNFKLYDKIYNLPLKIDHGFVNQRFLKRRFLNLLYNARWSINMIPPILLHQKDVVFGTEYYQYEMLSWLYMYQNYNMSLDKLKYHFQQQFNIIEKPFITQKKLVDYYIILMIKQLDKLLKMNSICLND